MWEVYITLLSRGILSRLRAVRQGLAALRVAVEDIFGLLELSRTSPAGSVFLFLSSVLVNSYKPLL